MALAQILVLYICRNIPDVQIWIDNIRVLKRANVDIDSYRSRVDLIYARMHQMGLALDTDLLIAREPKTQYDFLGVEYDHVGKRIRPSPKTRDKLQQIKTEMHSDLAGIGDTRAIQIFGVILFAFDVLQPRLSRTRLYFCLKNMRRVAKRLDKCTTASAPSQQQHREHSTGAFWHSCPWLQVIDELANEDNWSTWQLTNDTFYTIFTDASESGWGATCIHPDGSIKFVAGTWPEWLQRLECNIAELEAAAFVNAMLTLHIPHGVQIDLRVDNTTLLYGTRRGITHNFRMNQVLHSILSLLKTKNATIIRTGYVKSANNPADWLSRLNDPAPTSVRHTDSLAS